jgi:hypothetical protein
VEYSIRQRVLRTLAIGAFAVAIVPPAAVFMSRPPATKSIVLHVSLQPADDNPVMSDPTATSASR